MKGLSAAQMVSVATMAAIALGDTPGLGSGLGPNSFKGGVAVPFKPHGPHIGRNDPCKCGSGKKFKKCCLK